MPLAIGPKRRPGHAQVPPSPMLDTQLPDVSQEPFVQAESDPCPGIAGDQPQTADIRTRQVYIEEREADALVRRQRQGRHLADVAWHRHDGGAMTVTENIRRELR